MAAVTPEELAVWGDELLELGDSPGQLVVDRPRDDAFREAYERQYFPISRPKCTWRYGVIHRLKVTTSLGREAMEEIVACPAMKFLHELVFQTDGAEDVTDPIPVLITHGLPERVRDLALSLSGLYPDLGDLYPRLAKLERFTVSNPNRLGVMHLPALKWLRLVGFQRPAFEELALAKLPLVETLEVWTGDEAFVGPALPYATQLTKLVVNLPTALSPNAPNQWETFFSSPLLKQVPHLEILSSLDYMRERLLLTHVSELTRYESVTMHRPSLAELHDKLWGMLGKKIRWQP